MTSALVAILVCAAAAQTAAQPDTSSSVSIKVDLARPVGVYKPISSWFGYDESNYTTMKYGEQLLGELHDLSAAPVYIRAHHLLTSGNGVAELKWSSSNVFSLDKDGKPVYDFTITDRTFDEFKRAGVRPFVELGFMPKDLVASVPRGRRAGCSAGCEGGRTGKHWPGERKSQRVPRSLPATLPAR